MRKVILITIFFVSFLMYDTLCTTHDAYADKITFKSPIVYRSDAQGDYTFTKGGKLNGTVIGQDGSVQYVQSPGTYELIAPYASDGTIAGISASWTFTGQVRMELSTTGNPGDYTPVTNGVPLEWGKFTSGTKILWRATLAPGSTLSEVRINYIDLSGVIGSWGSAELTGFTRRLPLYIRGQGSGGGLFNYQLQVRVGESPQAQTAADMALQSSSQSAFTDIRFVQKDEVTLLPYWLEGITGSAPNRVATFWVKMPQIPPEGLIPYVYYGKAGAKDLSSGAAVFDFFDDFQNGLPDPGIWDTSVTGKISSKTYKFTGGILEFKAGTPAGVYYYKATSDGATVTFKKYDTNMAEVKTAGFELLNGDMLNTGIIELATQGVTYYWVRARQFTTTPPVIDTDKTNNASEESTNLAEFSGTVTAPNGDLALADNTESGYYISPLVHSPFAARIVIPGWTETGLEPGISKGSDSDVPGSKIAVDFSTDESGAYKQDCDNGKYYYASKADFKENDSLRWRIRLTRPPANPPTGEGSPGLKLFTLDFRRGLINIVLPNGKEAVPAGATYTIVWNAPDYEQAYTMNLAYSSDGGRNYNTIAAAANTGRYVWSAPAELTDTAMIKVADSLYDKVYDVSKAFFSVVQGAAGAQQVAQPQVTGQESGTSTSQQAAEATPEEIPGTKGKMPGTQLYELLIKVGDNSPTNPGEDQAGFYKEGDIVVIKPAGFNWSQTEKNSFLILQAYLTEKEVQDLTQPKETVVGKDKQGRDITKKESVRRYRINFAKQGVVKDKIAAMRGYLAAKPLVKVAAIEEKAAAAQKPDVAEKVKKLENGPEEQAK